MSLAIDLGGAALLAAAFLAALLVGGRVLRGDLAGPRDEPWDSARAMVGATEPARAAILLGACIALLGAVGAVAAALDLPGRAWRLNQEQSIASYFSSLLLFASATVAALIGRDAADARPWMLIAITLFAVGVDEAAELHERVEVRTGLPAPVVVAPLALLGAVGLWGAIPRMRAVSPVPTLFGAGVAMWVVSQALDPIHATWKSVVEELLEMGGSALILLALLFVARSGAARAVRPLVD